jgi:hypothetical protein
LKIENANGCPGYDCYESIDVKIGRRLVAGETFYVDSVRYDMPAIYVMDDDDSFGFDLLKFITFQSPIPKDDGGGTIKDDSHVPDQYLERLPAGDYMWMLYPFDMDHWMIDDIGLPKCYMPHQHLAGLLLDEQVGPLEYSWEDQTIEERFNSSLFERLDTTEGGEDWIWFGVNTKPNQYTLFDLPDQEKTYKDDYAESTYYTDGYEYLLTSSFIAPNSDKLPDTCMIHEIFDKVYNQVSFYKGSMERYDYQEKSRVAFEFDASDFTGIYINTGDNSCPDTDPDYATTIQNIPVTIPVLTNDHDPDGDDLTIIDVTDGNDGVVSIIGDQVKYTPDETFLGTDYFTYTVTDGECEQTEDVTVTVEDCSDCTEPKADWHCDADVENGKYTACIGELIMFDATGSFDQDEDGAYIADYKWDWDDTDGVDDWEDIGDATPTHQYSTAGTYYVTVHVTDDEGETDTFPEGTVTEQKIPIVIEECNDCIDLYVVPDEITIENCCDATGVVDIRIGDATDVQMVHLRIEWDPTVVDLDPTEPYRKDTDWTWYQNTVEHGEGWLTADAYAYGSLTGPQDIIELVFTPDDAASDGEISVVDITDDSFVNIQIGDDFVDKCVDDNDDGLVILSGNDITKGDVWSCDGDPDGNLDHQDLIQMAHAIYVWGSGGEFNEDDIPNDTHECASRIYEEYDTYEDGSQNDIVNHHDLIILAGMIYG